MANAAKQIRFSTKSRITQIVRKDGSIKESWIETSLVVPSSSEKVSVQKRIDYIQKLCDECKISGAFANEIARIVKNWKPRKNTKRINEPNYILTAQNQKKFRRSLRTLVNEFSIAKIIYEKSNEWKIKRPDQLKDLMFNKYMSMLQDYPSEFPALPDDIRASFTPPAYIYRLWYCKRLGKAKWEIENVSNEEIMAYFNTEVKTAQNKPQMTQDASAPEPYKHIS